MISLFTFDIFGTVLDWKGGLERELGRPVTDEEFDRFIDFQGRDEQAAFSPYRDITARSLVLFGVDGPAAERIGRRVGTWPLFADSVEGMRRLSAIAPCYALTNSDLAHGEQVQEQLGFELAGWISAEEIRSYKPALGHWEVAARRSGLRFDPQASRSPQARGSVSPRSARLADRSWWHVSAYGDYDLSVARRLGLTCVYIPRPHRRPGPHDLEARDLVHLAEIAA
jgi:2-haloacid dehalogenase